MSSDKRPPCFWGRRLEGSRTSDVTDMTTAHDGALDTTILPQTDDVVLVSECASPEGFGWASLGGDGAMLSVRIQWLSRIYRFRWLFDVYARVCQADGAARL